MVLVVFSVAVAVLVGVCTILIMLNYISSFLGKSDKGTGSGPQSESPSGATATPNNEAAAETLEAADVASPETSSPQASTSSTETPGTAAEAHAASPEIRTTANGASATSAQIPAITNETSATPTASSGTSNAASAAPSGGGRGGSQQKPVNEATWSQTHENCVNALRQHDDRWIRDSIEAIGNNLNAVHTERDAHFSLLFHSVVSNSHSGFRQLLNAGADPMWVNRSGNTVLTLISKRGLVTWADNCVDKLSESQKVAFVNHAQGQSGWTLFMSLCSSGDEKLNFVIWMIRNGAIVNKPMPQTGWTALHSAAKAGNVQILTALIQHGGDPTLRASHRELGRNLTVAQCNPNNQNVQRICSTRPQAAAVR